MWAQLDFFLIIFITLSFQIKKFKFQKFCPRGFLWPKSVNKMKLVWTLTPNKFWIKCLRCLVFAQTIVFNQYFMETTTLISIWLQLSHNGGSKLLKIFIKSISLTILSYHYRFFKKKKSFYFKLTSIILLSTMKPEKMRSLSEMENEI